MTGPAHAGSKQYEIDEEGEGGDEEGEVVEAGEQEQRDPEETKVRRTSS